MTLPNGGSLLFKTVDQGARAYQADSWDFWWVDEDPEDEAVFNEGRVRLIDRRGRCLVTMTPLRGLTWVWRRFVNDVEDGSRCKWIFGGTAQDIRTARESRKSPWRVHTTRGTRLSGLESSPARCLELRRAH